MSKNIALKALSLAVCVGLSSNAFAEGNTLVLEDLAKEKLAQQSQVDQQAQIIQETNAKLEKQRAQFQKLFAKAYTTYSNIPEGMLESLAFVATRWEHRMPDGEENHLGMPQTYGLFGLYDSEANGFTNTLGMIANAYGVDQQAMIDDLETYVMATAAFIEREVVDNALQGKSIESYRPVLAKLSGIPTDNSINQYATNSFVFDAFNVLERGYDDHGINIKNRPVQWQKAFTKDELKLLRAKGLFINADTGEISLKGEDVEPKASATKKDSEQGESLKADDGSESNYTISSTDYPPALWVTSPNYSARNDTISHVAIHTMQGSYSGSISWFQNPSSSASAHYMVRSSDGQVTQMVRESNKAWHARTANPYTIGIEHEGYVSNPAWYTDAMYNSSADITSHICSKYSVNCGNAYSGSAHSGVVTLSQTYTVKGHQHYPDQTHTDPGINWNWSKYANLVNGGSGGGTPSTTILDSFESSEGHFNLAPAYSGSTVGISTSSTAVRTTSIAKNGTGSEQILLVDDAASSANWSVRFLSGSGSPSNNTSMTVANGRVGFWVYSGGTGLTAAVAVDDGSGTERSISRTIPASTWTFLQWNLDDASQWNAWYGSANGQLDSSTVTLDAIWFYRAQTSYNVYVYIDDVQHSVN
ncbi:N-acetylmuramoyl-L-alanine amidase [Paraneptunicella aestuarii]|uniref:N-acetylmuramoyl-L-alanine amidase n=1 Tax=Paraneptunicella aestuarii TaxID=2831148 RepID=UPI001E57BE01|nr:peptidoglycan recognition family protein [Paraneptunicella aestuarii]UAA39420.1 N-acetylmuramoyl-L-alanine amidase [Paraneptunicella aestuarii]